MSDDLRLDHVLGLIGSLRATLEEFSTREAALEREFHLNNHTNRADAEEAIEREQENLAAALEQSAEAYEARKTALEARFSRRKARIERGFKASKQRLQRNIAERESNRVYDLQMSMIRAQRQLGAERGQAQASLDEFEAHLGALRERADGLRQATAKAFRGYGSFSRMLRPSARRESEADPRDEYTIAAETAQLLETAKTHLSAFRRLGLPRFFSGLPMPLIAVAVLIGGGALAWVLHRGGHGKEAFAYAGTAAGGLLALFAILHAAGAAQAKKAAKRLAGTLETVRRQLQDGSEKAAARFGETVAGLESELQESSQAFDRERKLPSESAAEIRARRERELDAQAVRVGAKNELMGQTAFAQLESARATRDAGLENAAELAIARLSASRDESEAKLAEAYAFNWEQLAAEWRRRVDPLHAEVAAIGRTAGEWFPAWTPANWKGWQPPAGFFSAAQFGRLEVDAAALVPELPKDARLALPGPAAFDLPAALTFPLQGSIVFETSKNNPNRDAAIGAVNDLVFRLLTVTPPGKLSFTLIDPVGLGESFSGLMHLADHDESLINSRVWTQTQQIEQRLADLNAHMEKVIQMYLRNEFSTIADYNEQAGRIAEKYRFVVVADFPANFSEIAAKRLLSIAASGARCGVYTIIHWDKRQPAIQGFQPEDLARAGIAVIQRGDGFALKEGSIDGARLVLDTPPPVDFATELVHVIGSGYKDANRVEVPFEDVTPPDGGLWIEDTTEELRVPIGRTGATKLQYLAIGKGTRQHTLIAGKTGSGKSTLLHVIITNLALWCDPDQVEFYLVDFKKGVEFKAYATANLPHARVIAIESDREFGLSVLQRIDDELKRRGEMFRKLGVQDIPGYKRAGGTEAVPRTLLIIDEFQEFFVEDDRIAQNANVLLDRIVRQGRAFGIHVILGSQTLGGAYTLARTTLGQMVIRIALQCNEADAYLIMDDTNPAPRLLTRPGEGIYNDQAGMIEGNSPFQVVWISDADRDAALRRVRRRAEHDEKTRHAAPIVFEGNAPADIRENSVLTRQLAAPAAAKRPAEAHAFLGAPNSIKGPTEAVFHRQSGNHLLIAGQRDEAALALVGASVVSIAAQFPRDAARFVVVDASPPETPEREFLENLARAVSHDLILAKPGDLDSVFGELGRDLRSRTEDEAVALGAPSVFVIVNGLQKFKKLRHEEDFSFSLDDSPAAADPGKDFDAILCEGAAVGIHVIAVCDTYNNLNRSLSRKAQGEFELRVLFQMSANDSASLIDSPKAASLGLHRALFHNEQEGYLETFRPYHLPENDWLEETGRALAKKAAEPAAV
ncbi:MAG: ATP-binding protein [Verrucomicrobiae bacterium]|nr:ATP-binding protein [Verrucomicrobiae bacterium]